MIILKAHFRSICVEFFCFLLKILFIYSEKERERESVYVQVGAEGERESQADSWLSMEPDMGLKLMTLRS